MADLTDYYSAGSAVNTGRPTQAPQGGPAISGNVAVSGGLGAANVDLWGAVVLLGIAFLLLHLE